MELLLEKGAQINIRRKNGWTSLHEATFDSQLNTVQFLISNGAKTNIKTKDGSTALHFAVKKGKIQ